MKLIFGKSKLTKSNAYCNLTNDIDKCCRLSNRFRSYLVYVPQSEVKNIYVFAIRIPGQTIGTLCVNEAGEIQQIVFSNSCTENNLYTDRVKEIAEQYMGEIIEKPFLPADES